MSDGDTGSMPMTAPTPAPIFDTGPHPAPLAPGARAWSLVDDDPEAAVLEHSSSPDARDAQAAQAGQPAPAGENTAAELPATGALDGGVGTAAELPATGATAARWRRRSAAHRGAHAKPADLAEPAESAAPAGMPGVGDASDPTDPSGSGDTSDSADTAKTEQIGTTKTRQPVATPRAVPGQYYFLKWWQLVALLFAVWIPAAGAGLGLFYWWREALDKRPVVFVVLVYVVVCAVAAIILSTVPDKPLIAALSLAVMSAVAASALGAAVLYGHSYCQHTGSRCVADILPY